MSAILIFVFVVVVVFSPCVFLFSTIHLLVSLSVCHQIFHKRMYHNTPPAKKKEKREKNKFNGDTNLLSLIFSCLLFLFPFEELLFCLPTFLDLQILWIWGDATKKCIATYWGRRLFRRHRGRKKYEKNENFLRFRRAKYF